MIELSDNTESAVPSQTHPKESKFISLLKWVKSLQLRPQLKLLCRILADYTGNNATCWPSVATLAGEMCVSKRTIQRYIAELERLNVISKHKRLRPNGSHTSNRYRFIVTSVASGVSPPENSTKKSNNHGGQDHDGIYKQETDSVKSEVVKPLPPSMKRIKPHQRKAFKIEPEKMYGDGSFEYAIYHWNIAKKNRWLGDSEYDRLDFFSSWAAVVRRFREGKISNPASYFVKIIKDKAHHSFPTNQDHDRGSKFIRQAKQIGLL